MAVSIRSLSAPKKRELINSMIDIINSLVKISKEKKLFFITYQNDKALDTITNVTLDKRSTTPTITKHSEFINYRILNEIAIRQTANNMKLDREEVTVHYIKILRNLDYSLSSIYAFSRLGETADEIKSKFN